MLKPDDVISFSEQIIFGSKQTWGKFWTQRDIDGFYYNEFMNQTFQLALGEARRNRQGHQEPPHPCRWDDTNAQELFITPWGNRGIGLPDIDAQFVGSEGPKGFHWDQGKEFRDLFEGFCLNESYLYNTLLHGTPVPFMRLWATADDNHPLPSSYRIEIYSSPIGELEKQWIKRAYGDFWGWQRPEPPAGANIVVNFLSDGPPRIEILSHPPYASPSVFVQVVKEAIIKHRAELPGTRRHSALTTIREWTVYLLTEKCDFGNKDAIKLWNEMLGDKFGNQRGTRYNLDDDSFEPDPGRELPRSQLVTSSGETQYSGDKADLEKRINFYRRTIPGDNLPM